MFICILIMVSLDSAMFIAQIYGGIYEIPFLVSSSGSFTDPEVPSEYRTYSKISSSLIAYIVRVSTLLHSMKVEQVS